MHFRVVSLRTPLARLLLLTLVLISAVWFINPRIRATSATATKPIPVYRVETSDRAMALTINVVWGTEYVPQLLNDLRQAGVVATFMVGGAWAEAHPDIVKMMRQDGDEIGNHGWNHRHPNQLGFTGNVKDITRTNEMIAAIGKTTPTVYAPPYGEFNQTVLQAAQSAHMTLVMWTIDTIDWRPSSTASYMVTKVLKHAHAGSIVLMHPTDRTATALPQIIQRLKEQGYRLVTVSQLLHRGTPKTDG